MNATHKRVSLLLLASGLAACSATGPSASGGSTVSFNTATQAGTPLSGRNASFSISPSLLTVALGANTLELTDVQLVARHIELQREGKDVTCETDVNHEEDCEELNVGPVLLDLTLAPGASQSFSVQVAAGTYDKAELHIHQVSSGDAADAAFLSANPGFDGVSIKATGTYNGTPFTFTTGLDAEQEMALSPPITTDGSTPASMTLFVDVSSWFKTADGTGLVDPATALAGQPNQSVVENNIKRSFEAFEDENHDGESDH
ncbi:MAG: hypothetical protein ACM3NS_07525 [Deltaproteobacteria bacterium]